MITVEQIVNTQKTNVETFFGLTGKAFEGVEKLIELNISAAKNAITEAAQTTQAALSAKDAQELLALQQSLVAPAAEKAAAYGRYVYEIAASTGAEVTRVAEAQGAEVQAKFMALVDTALKNAPAGAGEWRCPDQVGRRRRDHRDRDRAEGCQASSRTCRSELQRDLLDRRPRDERQEGLIDGLPIGATRANRASQAERPS